MEGLDDEFEPMSIVDDNEEQGKTTTSIPTDNSPQKQEKSNSNTIREGSSLIQLSNFKVAMRITPHVINDNDIVSIGSKSPELKSSDQSLMVISCPPLETFPDSPIISSILSPISTITKSKSEAVQKQDPIALQSQMRRFFEGDDSWEDVEKLDVCKFNEYGIFPALTSTEIDVEPTSQYPFSNNEPNWVNMATVSPPIKAKSTQHQRERMTMTSPLHTWQEQHNQNDVGDSCGADDHRVIEWIRECHQPRVNLMDDILKVPGPQSLDLIDERIDVYIYCSTGKSP